MDQLTGQWQRSTSVIETSRHVEWVRDIEIPGEEPQPQDGNGSPPLISDACHVTGVETGRGQSTRHVLFGRVYASLLNFKLLLVRDVVVRRGSGEYRIGHCPMERLKEPEDRTTEWTQFLMVFSWQRGAWIP